MYKASRALGAKRSERPKISKTTAIGSHDQKVRHDSSFQSDCTSFAEGAQASHARCAPEKLRPASQTLRILLGFVIRINSAFFRRGRAGDAELIWVKFRV